MNKIEAIVSLTITLIVGAFLGYYFTNANHNSKEVERAQSEERMICRLELREGDIGEVKSKYIAVFEGRDRSDCEDYIPTGNLPNDTEIFWLGGL